MTRLQRWSLAVITSAVLHAQPAPFEIRGTVTEPGVGPVAGAEVRTVSSPFREQRTELSAFTNGRGEFVLRPTTPGQYTLGASREGYVIAGAYASVNADHPSATVGISILRLGRIFGRVLDTEKREPLPDVTVYVVQKERGLDGISRWGRPASSLQTDRAGYFETFLPRGDYAVTTVNPGQRLSAKIRTEYSPDDLKVVDQDFETSYWPSGTAPETAVPVALPSGGTLNVGDVLVKKLPHYRAHVAIPQGDCPGGESIQLFLLRRGSAASFQTVPCGKDVLLHHLAPGAYTLYAVSAWQGERERVEDAVWANASLVITDENAEVTLALHRGIVLDVQITAAEGLALPDQWVFGFFPAWVDSATLPVELFVQTGKDGKLRMAVSPGDQRLSAPFFTKIRYNGSPVPGLTIPFRSGAPEQRLEMVYDNRLARFTGRIVDGERAIPGRIILWSDAQFGASEYFPEGVFRFERLPAGEYRLSVIRSSEVDPTFDPSRGEKITLKPGETLNLDLKPR